MKRIKFFIASAIVLSLVSCGAKEAAEFNNKLINIQKDFLTEVTSIRDKGQTLENYKKIEDVITKRVAEIDAIKAPADGADFKSAMRADLSGLKDDYDLQIKLLDPNLTEEDKTNLASKEADIISKISANDEKVLVEQKKYANAHNVKLQ